MQALLRPSIHLQILVPVLVGLGKDGDSIVVEGFLNDGRTTCQFNFFVFWMSSCIYYYSFIFY